MGTRQLSDKRPDGAALGQAADDKIAFYGAPPVAQQVLATGATTAQIAAFLALIGLSRLT